MQKRSLKNIGLCRIFVSDYDKFLLEVEENAKE